MMDDKMDEQDYTEWETFLAQWNRLFAALEPLIVMMEQGGMPPLPGLVMPGNGRMPLPPGLLNR